MLVYHGGTNVKGGFFWKISRWEIVTIEGKSGVLPEGPERSYVRIPAILLVPAALVVGGVYVVFLPFVGIFMLAHVIFQKAAKSLGRLAHATRRKRLLAQRAATSVEGPEQG